VSWAFDVGAVRARCEAATPGPWGVGDGLPFDESYTPFVFDLARDLAIADFVVGTRRYESALNDAHFVRHARTDLPAALDEIEALREALADARTSALEEAAGIADTYCGDGVALDQWTPRGDGERTRDDIARDIRAAISAPRVDRRDAEIAALKARIAAILAMLDAEDSDLARHLAEKARALA
jgi:hypothetical protein